MSVDPKVREDILDAFPTRAVVFGLMLVVFWLFVPTFRHEFLNWDDYSVVVENPAIRSLGWKNFTTWFANLSLGPGHYIPLTWFSLAVDYHFWGLNPLGYHVTNTVLHAFNTVLLFFLCRALLGLFAGAGSASEEDIVSGVTPIAPRSSWFWKNLAAGAAALFFGVHPLRVESVVWVTERRDVLGAFFCLASWLAYLKSRAISPCLAGRPERFWKVISLILFLASLMSKVSAVTLPLVFLMMDVYPYRRLRVLRPSRWRRREWGLLWEKIPFFLLSGVFAVLAPLAVQSGKGGLASLDAIPLSHRFLPAVYNFYFFLEKTVFPFSMSPLYQHSRFYLEHPIQPEFVWGLVVVVLVTISLFVLSRRFPWLLFCWAAYDVLLLPIAGVSGIFQAGPQMVAERHGYYPSFALAVVLGFVLWKGWEGLERKGWKWSGGVGLGLIVLVVLNLLAWQTLRYGQVWKNSLTLWRYAVEHESAESSLANNNLAETLIAQGKYDEGVPYARKAIEVDPNNHSAHINLAAGLWWSGHTSEAFQEIETAEKLTGGKMAHVKFVEGEFLNATGRIDEAVEAYRETIRRDPDNQIAAVSLAMLLRERQGPEDEQEANRLLADVGNEEMYSPDYHMQKRIASPEGEELTETEEAFREATNRYPWGLSGRNEMAMILVRRGRLDEAEDLYRRILSHRPESESAWNNLGLICLRRGEYEEAMEAFDRALEIRPEFSEAQNNRGLTLMRQERFEEAVPVLQQTIRLTDSLNLNAYLNLVTCYEKLQKSEEAQAVLEELRHKDPEAASRAEKALSGEAQSP